MTFFRRLFPRLIAVAALSASSFASAASIDFTASSPWSGANNQTTFGAGIATLTATASGGGIAPVLRFNSPGVCTGAAISLSCNGDGIGLYAPISVPFVGQVDLSTEIDRLGRNEVLMVNFSHAVNITSIEVEDALFAHPSVAEAAVIGVPDEKWGETVKALVVLGADKQATERELIDHCRARLAHYKCPTSVEFRAELTRTATGKLQKFLLRAPYWEGRSRQVN